MSDVKHTALPWHVDTWGDVFSSNGEKIAGTIWDVKRPKDANARYIVTACNAYPALVEALEQVEQNASHTADCLSRHPMGECTCFKSIVSRALAQTQGDE